MSSSSSWPIDRRRRRRSPTSSSRVADNKYFLAHRLAGWGVGAPALESAVACTAIAQEEAGHARGLYSLLEDFPAELRPVPLEREDDRARKYAVSFLLEASDSWYRAVAATALMDSR